MQYRTYPHWNIVLGCRAVRVSTSDHLGHEFFAIVRQDEKGRANKELRLAALDAIEAHMKADGPPGEVEFHG